MAEAYTAYLFACPEGKSSTRGARGRKSKPDGHDDEHQRPGCRAEIGPTWRTAGWRQVEQPGRRITQPTAGSCATRIRTANRARAQRGTGKEENNQDRHHAKAATTTEPAGTHQLPPPKPGSSPRTPSHARNRHNNI